MASTAPNYYQPNTNPGDQFDTDQQQASQDYVPGKDAANPAETEEQKKARLLAEQQNNPTLKPPADTSGGYKPNAAGGTSTDTPYESPPFIGQPTPMIGPDGSVPVGEPYSPSPIHVTAPTVAQTGGTTAPPAAAPTQQPTGQALENQWMDFANTVLGQKGQVGVAGGNAEANALAASSRNNLQPVVDQYNQKYGANATAVGEDRIDFHDGRGPVDVIAGGGNNSQWWFGSPTGGGSGGASGGNPPPTALTPPVDLGPQTRINSDPLPSTPAIPGAAAPPAYAPDLNNPAFNQTPPEYSAQDVTQYTAPDQLAQMGGLNELVGRITGAPDPTYNPSDISQYTAPDQTAANSQISQLISQLMNTQAPTYDASKITQFSGTKTPELSGLQDQRMKDILSNPTYSQDYINKLNEQQKEMILQRGVGDREALANNAARRGVTNSGYTEAAQRRLVANETGDLLKSNRDVELNTTGANRQSVLDALASSQGVLGSRAGIESEQYKTGLAGEQAQAAEKGKAYQALLDAIGVKNNAVNTASGALNDMSSRSTSQYGAKLSGETARAGENSKAFDAKIAAGNLRNNSASTAAGVLGTQANIAQGNYGSTLAGQSAKNAEAARAYDSKVAANAARTNQAALLEQLKQAGAGSALDTAKFGENQRQFDTQSGLARDQFNTQTKQFDRNFIEQVRQFDAQLAQQMAQFNASNQQGYDLANLNSQDRMLDRLMSGA